MQRKWLAGLIALVLSITACGISQVSSTLSEPPDLLSSSGKLESILLGDTHTRPLPVGKKAVFSSAHSDPNGIRNVRFYVDGTPITDETPHFAQTFMKVDFEWTPPEAKSYTLKIEAHSADEKTPPSVITFVVTAVQANDTAAAPPPSSAQPTPTSTTIACSNENAFVSDVTIPDGSTIQPGAAFVKTWRIKNTGTCNWSESYTFRPVSGPALGASATNIPFVHSGNTVDLSLSMTAPTEAGQYRSYWQLFDAKDRAFGKQFFVDFVVPQTSCQPAPTINWFQANPTTITAGQSATLSWDVAGADTVIITPSGGGVSTTATGNSMTVWPDKTTTYTLEAKKGACTVVAQVTITVQAAPSCQGLAINYFTATPSTIRPGETSTLGWEVVGATSVTISPLNQMRTAASTLTVSPNETTTYELEAKNAVCTLTRQVTVTVVQKVVLLDFVAAAPGAVWQTNLGTLPWGGSPADAAGYVRWLNNVALQNGQLIATALDIHPRDAAYIQGQYTANWAGGVQPTDQLQLTVGYMAGTQTSSGATYSVKFIPATGPVVNITTLTVDPNGALQSVTVPLSQVSAGQQGTFVLQVDRGASPDAGVALFAEAKLVRP